MLRVVSFTHLLGNIPRKRSSFEKNQAPEIDESICSTVAR